MVIIEILQSISLYRGQINTGRPPHSESQPLGGVRSADVVAASHNTDTQAFRSVSVTFTFRVIVLTTPNFCSWLVGRGWVFAI